MKQQPSICLQIMVFIVAIGCWSQAASAQIVNVQQLAGKAVSEGLSGTAALSLDQLAGNSTALTTSGSGTLFLRQQQWLSLVTIAGAYGIKGTNGTYSDIPFQSKIFEHLRVRREITEQWAVEAFVQHEYDRWRRLKTRALGGMGVRLDLQPTDKIHLAWGLAYMLQGEELLKPGPADPRGLTLEHRASTYVSAAAAISATLAITLTIYAQPRLDDPSDLRGLVDVALQIAAAKNFGLKLGYILGYDLQPPANVHHYDGATKVALTAAF